MTLAFAGDVHFEAELRARLRDPRTALAPVAAALSAPDLTVVTLESAITGRGTRSRRSTTSGPHPWR